MLPPAPESVLDASSRPRVGAYQGWVPDVSWDTTADTSRASRLFRGKHWHFVSMMGKECVISFAIIDAGYAASAFAYAFDRERRQLIADLAWTSLPGASRVARTAGAGARSRFSARGAELLIDRPAGSATWQIRAHVPGLDLEATLDASNAPPTLCAIARPERGIGNCTHKTMELAVKGEATARGKRFDLAGFVGSMDHTSGLMARDTRWRWASGSRPGLSLNLVQWFNGPVENALWVDGKIVPVGAAEFEFDPRAPLDPWRITTSDGAVDLEFHPEGKRAEDKNMLVAVSRYVQPIGTFRGTIKPGSGRAPITVTDLVGVTEDHVARW